jgi:predicted Ser/Thr protein kinase
VDRLILEHRLTHVADAIAAVLAPGVEATNLQADVLREGARAVTLKVDVKGARAIVKLFEDGVEAEAAYAREVRALEGFQGTSVPRLLLTAPGERMLMMSEIRGQSLAEVLKDHNVVQMAEFLGQWFGRLASVAPEEAVVSTWWSYLEGYGAQLDAALLSSQKPLLQAMPIRRLRLAHNDNALSNFIRGRDKRLYGIDFESCRMKPEGWDLVMAADAFFRRAPSELATISTSLLRGYNMTAGDKALPEQFDAVMSAVVVAGIVAAAAD